ncbi:MAG: L,D-transpeptidase family protein [Actinobacteria bacterium]|nr:L,D-transpeptidase family protein [Actinomycetota bacterium]MBU1494586.1 L,D-transpeptidase family protein [Actinomycetota bacterium]MBU1866526.1 L,D-transpeptidase family protein [Actinomycetota bacterium]
MRRSVMIGFAVVAGMAFTASAGAEGRAAPSCDGKPATIWGTSGNDTLTGTPGDDVISGRGGGDIISGRGGDDVICGGPGADEIHGGGGNDLLIGGGGADVVIGGAGDDVLVGNYGPDLLEGGGGADRLSGGDGSDTLRGDGGDDILGGGGGFDAADGGWGADACDTEKSDACEQIALAEGDRGRAVRILQQTLRDHRLYRGRIDGRFDREVAVAVATFHKVTGPAHANPNTAVAEWKAHPPSERFALADWARLLAFDPEPPKARTKQPDRVEVDIGHQVLYLILDDEVDAIIGVSTGYYPNATPRTTNLRDGGYFWYQHPYNGWSPLPGGWSIYKFWAYRAGSQTNYGVHGYRYVPYWPASHGCTRVEVWEADYLHPIIFVGMPMHVWDK